MCYHLGMGIIISTDNLIPSSEARKRIGQLIDDIQKNEGNYYVLLNNGKVAALLVHPDWLEGKMDAEFTSLEKLRTEWNRYTKDISTSLDKLEKMDKKDLPELLK